MEGDQLGGLPTDLPHPPRPSTASPHSQHTLGLPWVGWVCMDALVAAVGSGDLPVMYLRALTAVFAEGNANEA